MKKTNALWLIVAIASFCIAGCATTRAVPYSFAEEGSGTATILFNNSIRLLDFEGNIIPGPENGTRWEPISFPAGREFLIKVNVVDTGMGGDLTTTGTFLDIIAFVLFIETIRGAVNRNVYFVCPPLEAGKEYTIHFNSRSIRRDSIELREKGTGIILRGKKVVEQTI
jgi:hypothetical protein